MSSVQLGDGSWHKRCMKCGEWTNYNDLMYEKPSEAHPYGLDVCPACGTNAVPQVFTTVKVN